MHMLQEASLAFCETLPGLILHTAFYSGIAETLPYELPASPQLSKLCCSTVIWLSWKFITDQSNQLCASFT